MKLWAIAGSNDGQLKRHAVAHCPGKIAHLNPTPPVVKAYWKGLLVHRSLSNFDVGIDQLALTIEQKTMQPLYCLTFPSSLAFLFYK